MALMQRAVAIAGLALVTAAASASPPQFTLTPLPGRATTLNDSNIAALVKPYDANRVVGGLYNLDTSAFTALTVAMPQVNLTDIADSGWVSGIIKPTGGNLTIVAWNPSRVRATIRTTTKPVVIGPFVNSSGRVAWGESFSGGNGRAGYAWAPVAGLTTNAPLTSISHAVTAVSPQGWILGSTPTASPRRATIVSASGTTQSIPLPPGATSTDGVDANARNQFLLATVGAGIKGHIWTRSTNTFQELSDPLAGRFLLFPTRFNDIGDVVGMGTTIGSPFPEPMLWVGSTGYTFLELLGGSLPAGWTAMYQPLGINDNGYILGWGTYNGTERYYVLKPVAPWHP